MSYLLDASVILELLMDGPEADAIERLLRESEPGSLYLSEVALHALGNVLVHESLYDTFTRTLDDLLLSGTVRIARLGGEDLDDVAAAARRDRLNYDDAYAAAVAGKMGLTLVSLDAHFDATKQGRTLPSAAVRPLESAS